MIITTNNKKEVVLPPRKPPPCRETQPNLKEHKSGEVPIHYGPLIKLMKLHEFYWINQSWFDIHNPEGLLFLWVSDAFPRDFKFAYMTPGYYAKGFRILDVYKTEVDFSEYRSLLFIEDLNLVHKWGHLKSRIPYPTGRITDLPGTRDLHYRNYCLRNMTPESAMSWRKSITQPCPKKFPDNGEESEPKPECICEE